MSEQLSYSEHAQIRMQERGITPAEVGEALENTFLPPPGIPSVKGHIWGRTAAGRALRISVLKSRPGLVVSVVAAEEAHESQVR